MRQSTCSRSRHRIFIRVLVIVALVGVQSLSPSACYAGDPVEPIVITPQNYGDLINELLLISPKERVHNPEWGNGNRLMYRSVGPDEPQLPSGAVKAWDQDGNGLGNYGDMAKACSEHANQSMGWSPLKGMTSNPLIAVRFLNLGDRLHIYESTPGDGVFPNPANAWEHEYLRAKESLRPKKVLEYLGLNPDGRKIVRLKLYTNSDGELVPFKGKQPNSGLAYIDLKHPALNRPSSLKPTSTQVQQPHSGPVDLPDCDCKPKVVGNMIAQANRSSNPQPGLLSRIPAHSNMMAAAAQMALGEAQSVYAEHQMEEILKNRADREDMFNNPDRIDEWLEYTRTWDYWHRQNFAPKSLPDGAANSWW